VLPRMTSSGADLLPFLLPEPPRLAPPAQRRAGSTAPRLARTPRGWRLGSAGSAR
jgi:hypothetical protein